MGQDMLMRRDNDPTVQFRVPSLNVQLEGVRVHIVGALDLDTALG
jgi:hypothetical protein